MQALGGNIGMQGFNLFFELVDGRTFSSPWFWVCLALVWHGATRSMLGVPGGLIRQAAAEQGEGPAAQDLDGRLSHSTATLLPMLRRYGLLLVAGLSGLLTALVLMAVLRGAEFAQGALCLILPLALVAGLRLRLVLRLAGDGLDAKARLALLVRHYDHAHAIGLVAVLMTVTLGLGQVLRQSLMGWP